MSSAESRATGVDCGGPLSGRVVLEPLRAEHAFELFEPLNDPRVLEHIGSVPFESAVAFAERFAFLAAGPGEQYPGMEWVNVAVRLRSTSQLMGRLEATLVETRAEVAYLLGPAYWGQGYAAEAMSLLHALLKAQHQVRELWATVNPANRRSSRLLERLGYAPAPRPWPHLYSYSAGDLVFHRSIN